MEVQVLAESTTDLSGGTLRIVGKFRVTDIADLKDVDLTKPTKAQSHPSIPQGRLCWDVEIA